MQYLHIAVTAVATAETGKNKYEILYVWMFSVSREQDTDAGNRKTEFLYITNAHITYK